MCHSRCAVNEADGGVSCGETSAFEGVSLPKSECPVCGHSFGEGDSVVLYACRGAGASYFEFGDAVCDDHTDSTRAKFTLGVYEVVLHARVGVCSDAVTQSSWLVLVAPEVKGVSGPSMTALNSPSSEAEVEGEGTRTLHHARIPRFDNSGGRR